MCVKYFGPTTRSLVSGSTTATFIPLTPWVAALSAKQLKSLIRVANSTGNFKSQLGIQTAAVDTDSPDAPIAKGQPITSDSTVCSGVIDITNDVAAKFYVRGGLLISNESGTALERADVSFAIGLEA